MKVENLKELEALLKTCNRQGVREIIIDGITLKLDGLSNATKPVLKDDKKEESTDEFSPEQILMWSSYGQDNAVG